MRMRRQVTVDMFHDAMVLFAGGVQGVHMNHGVGEMPHVMQQLMPHFCGNGMPLSHRQLRLHGNVQFGMQPMPNPPDAYLRDLLHFWQVANRVRDVGKDGGVYAI
jgi:hypothetical protein